MNIVEIAKTRYATKKFDPNKTINVETFAQIKQLLRYSPSSINSQPWHFVIASTAEGKARLAKGAQAPYNANQPKILDASHVILFCAKTEITDEYLQQVTDQEAVDNRFPQPEGKEMAMKVRRFYADLHRQEWHDVECWTQKQVYLNIGTVLLGAAALGVDAVPIEGVNFAVLNEEFALAEKGLTTVAVVALGYQAEDDFNARLPKSRFAEDELFTLL